MRGACVDIMPAPPKVCTHDLYLFTPKKGSYFREVCHEMHVYLLCTAVVVV